MPILRAHLVDGNDVGMVEARRRLRLGPEAGGVRRGCKLAPEEHLQGHGAAQASLPCLVNHAHSTAAQLFKDFIVAKAWRERWVRRHLSQGRGGGGFYRPLRPGHLFGDEHCPPEGFELARELGVFPQHLFQVRLAALLGIESQLVKDAQKAFVGWPRFLGRSFLHGSLSPRSVPGSARSRRMARKYRMPAAGSVRPSAFATSWFESCSKWRMRITS